MSAAGVSPALLNARYVAIRTAEAKGLTDELLKAARDQTPGVQRMLAPMLYRFWFRDRQRGWDLIERIADGSVHFPGLPDRQAIEIFGAVSMPILNACRHDPAELARLAAAWQTQVARLFGSPLARTARLLGRNWVLRFGASTLAEMLKRQPVYQPVNYQELKATFERPDAFRSAWRDALDCLEHPERAPDPIAAILTCEDLTFDLYLMLVCERALIQYGARHDPAGGIALLERLFHEGCPWFRQSVLYALLHILTYLPEVEDSWLARYGALAEEFFTSGSWVLQTAAGRYVMATHVANPDVVAWRRRDGRAPAVMPALLRLAIQSGDEEQVAALFTAIDGVAFYHGCGALALSMIESAHALGGAAVEQRVVASLASVRLLDQPLVDGFLEQRRTFAGIGPAEVAAAEPSITEDDLLTLLDGFIIHMMLTSDYFRAQLCGAFRRAIGAHGVQECLAQILEWARDELAGMRRA